MAKDLWMPVAFQQLDLFDIADRNEWEQKSQASRIDPKDFRIGDIFYVKWGNGLDFEGRLAAKGWWCDREDLKNYHWLDTGTGFRHFDPFLHEWMYKGHDDGYRAPSKDDIEERLRARLATVPLKNRIATYQQFQNEYPYLSAEYSPLMREAWDKAIVAVTTLDEFLAARKDWSCPVDIPPKLTKQVQQYVESVFWKPKDLWREELMKLRWTEGERRITMLLGLHNRI
ncbi:hypothetical protein [Alicyclobacillus fastidiosus]|uniref:hypothetical protein n=1 Tax=Alicyclobacillus fastidiosus TaxID=392011 RepID=UPI0023E98FF9|nr:hypothetical protein [Alicyclobacillus fastidiosus]GMA65634.1 hypothetical protein GCM10025859_60740 [Alicyclobacillus fastidiosus]GMA65852.1 hypothetical protein GCM10025859_62920 [Alicyclobacillus fastidiosus]